MRSSDAIRLPIFTGTLLMRGRKDFRHGLKMALFAQQALVCVVALLLAPSCARVDDSRLSNGPQPSNVVPSEQFDAAEAAAPFVLSPEDQTDDALAATRRADDSGRGGDGGLPQLTPQEHMRRAACVSSRSTTHHRRRRCSAGWFRPPLPRRRSGSSSRRSPSAT